MRQEDAARTAGCVLAGAHFKFLRSLAEQAPALLRMAVRTEFSHLSDAGDGRSKPAKAAAGGKRPSHAFGICRLQKLSTFTSSPRMP